MKLIKQHDIKDCGAACLSMVCRYYKLKLPMARLRELIGVDSQGANLYGIVSGAEQLGLKATALQGSAEELIDGIRKKELPFPMIARVIVDEMLEHYVVIYKMTAKAVFVADPGRGEKRYSYDEFFRIWAGQIVTFEKTTAFRTGNECKGTLMRFVGLIVRQKKLLCAVFLLSVLISVIGVLGAFVFQVLVDGVEHQADGFLGLALGQVCCGVMVLYLFQAGLSVLRGYCLSMLSQKVDLPLMLGYYNHIADLPMKHLNGRKTGELMARFNDAASIKDAISSATLSLMLDTLMVLLCVFVLWSLNRILFLVTLLTVLAYAVVMICFLRPIKRVNEALMEENAEVTSYLKESVDGIETVKAFGAEETVKAKTASKFTKFVKLSVKGSVIETVQDSLSGLVASVGAVILLWCGTAFVMRGVISLGTLITFYSLLGYFLDPIQRLIDLQPELQTAVVAAERLNDILDLEIEQTEKETLLHGSSIEVKHVSFRYGNRALVLRDISMNIEAGETVALVGESGSGKTTLAKLLLAFYMPEQGEIRIGGQKLSSAGVREHIAYVSQEVFLFSDTIRNNLTLGQTVSMEEIEHVCRLCRADEFIERLPLGYNTMLGENGHDLSGGQKQRLAIARALLKRPKILILDEATSNLDTIAEQSIKETIDQLSGEITCIIIAHRLSTIKNCDRIYVMQNGEVVEMGTHEQLLERNGEYRKFYTQTVGE